MARKTSEQRIHHIEKQPKLLRPLNSAGFNQHHGTKEKGLYNTAVQYWNKIWFVRFLFKNHSDQLI